MYNPGNADFMGRLQRGSMHDYFFHLRREVQGSNDFGEQDVEYVQGGPYFGGFDPQASQEVNVNGNVIMTTAELRVDRTLDGVIGPRDRVQIIRRGGKALGRQPIYEIVGEPEVGPSAMVLRLQQVQL